MRSKKIIAIGLLFFLFVSGALFVRFWALICPATNRYPENVIQTASSRVETGEQESRSKDTRFRLRVKFARTQQEMFVTLAELTAMGQQFSRLPVHVSPELCSKFAQKYALSTNEAQFMLEWTRSGYAGGDFRKYIQQGKQIGAICLQHNLSREAVRQILGPPCLDRPHQISYSLAGSQLLDFNFDNRGILLSVEINGRKLNRTGNFE